QREGFSAVAAEEAPVAEPVAPASFPCATVPTPALRARGALWPGLAAAALLMAGGGWDLFRPLAPPRMTAFKQITHDGRSKNLGGTDGSRLYFTLASPLTIEQVGINGGDATRVPLAVSDAQMQLGDVSSDGSSALVWTNEQGHVSSFYWVVSLL